MSNTNSNKLASLFGRLLLFSQIILASQIFLLAHFFPCLSWGAVSLSGVSSNIRTDGVSPALNLYGAFAYIQGTSNTNYRCPDPNGLCNTCIGSAGDTLAACSPVSAFASSNISFNFASSTALATGSSWVICATSTGTSTEITTTAGTPTGQNSTAFTWSSTWAQLCAQFGSTGCETSVIGAMTVGISTSSTSTCSSGLTDKIDFKVYIGSAIGTPSTPSEATTTGSHGEAYGFGLYPGDEKLYIPPDDFKTPGTFPKKESTGLEYTKLVFLYEKMPSPSSPDDFSAVTNASNSILLSVDTTGGVERDFLDGLENDQKYCFRMASHDTTGVISYFTPDAQSHCELPSEVIGLLSDKKCFIATAAFGSGLDPHVTTFRKFRNEFLLPSFLGRFLVRSYYRLSPPMAAFIAKSEILRTLTRGILWPLLGFVEVSLAWGLWVSLCGLLILIMLTRLFILKFFPAKPFFKSLPFSSLVRGPK